MDRRERRARLAGLGVDFTTGRHHPLAVEAARRAGVDPSRPARWAPRTADRFVAAMETVADDVRRMLAARDRLAAALAEHQVDGMDDLPLTVQARVLGCPPGDVAKVRARRILPEGWWLVPIPPGVARGH